MFALKKYQDDALDILERFLRRVRVAGIEAAWRECAPAVTQKGNQLPYRNEAFGEIPCVCLRLPTGGGKTLLAAHAVARIGKTYRDTDAPVVLWLTPSDTIRTQTAAALNTAGHPYRQALERDLPQPVRVLELDQLATVNPYEVGRQAIVLVATIQAFRVQDKKKTQRTVYAYDESLEPHFQGLTPRQTANLDTVQPADLESQPYLTAADLGKVKASLANFLHLTHPIVIVDEAHNNQTDTSFTTLKRLNPACVIELTATPVGGSNVLHSVSAQALKTEDMKRRFPRKDAGRPAVGNGIGRSLPVSDGGGSGPERPRRAAANRRQDRSGAMIRIAKGSLSPCGPVGFSGDRA